MAGGCTAVRGLGKRAVPAHRALMFRAAWLAILLLLWACSQDRSRPKTDELPGEGGRGGSTDGGGSGGSAGGGDGGSSIPEPPPTPIGEENRLPGDPDWQDGQGARQGEFEGYADRISARPGEAVAIRVSSDRPLDVTWKLYRIGWYGGAGARLLDEGSLGTVGQQPSCPMEPSGLVRCNWAETAKIPLPAGGLSGLHLIKLIRSDGLFHQLPLVVEDGRDAPILFQASVTTWQAYNEWGGASFYLDRTGTLPLGRAVEVGFDRPYIEGFGAGQMLRWEIHFAQFLERYGYDVTYATNLSLDETSLSGRKVFLSVGHDEYWTLAERNALEKARDQGTSLFFFSANTGYWKIRTRDPGADGIPRVLVCWKGDGHLDPTQGDERTGLWRNPPLSRPEHTLLGVMYESWMHLSHPWVVTDGSHWLYEGTGLQTGDTVPRMIGYEYDRTWPGGPGGLEVVGRSPVVDILGVPSFSEAAIHRAPGGAWIFGAGTIEWSWGLGRRGVADPRVERMTANLLLKAGLPLHPTIGQLEPPPPPRLEGSGAGSVATVASGLPPISHAIPFGAGFLATVPSEHRLIAIDGTGKVSTFAGGNGPGGDTGVPASMARFHAPTSLAIDGRGDVVVADTGNHCLRLIRGDGSSVVDLAGRCGAPGFSDGAGGAARFTHPMGLAWAPSGELLVADPGNGRVRAIRVPSGETRTVAGGGSTPADGPAHTTAFAYPTALATDPGGNVYVVDTKYTSIRRIGADGQVVTLVSGKAGQGHDDGTGSSARLAPQGGALWSGGALLVSEPANFAIRRIVPGGDEGSTKVETFAGGKSGTRDGPGLAASFGMPLGLSHQGSGILVADPGNGSLRLVVP